MMQGYQIVIILFEWRLSEKVNSARPLGGIYFFIQSCSNVLDNVLAICCNSYYNNYIFLVLIPIKRRELILLGDGGCF